jgi:hypothetical protein
MGTTGRGYVYGPPETSIEQINNTTGEVLYLHHDQAGSRQNGSDVHLRPLWRTDRLHRDRDDAPRLRRSIHVVGHGG